MRLRRNLPARCARTTRLCSSSTLKRPLGNFSFTVPVTSMLSSLLINLQVWIGGRPGISRVSRPAADSLGRCDVGCLQTLGALGHLELHSCAFIQAPISFRLNR